ncbi:MAG: T9SS type A sorting domain-containing protein [Saprospiraceae bacterium]|nr:T9SS type A sorting domain-containing protein [Saprospiraceae bacterium]
MRNFTHTRHGPVAKFPSILLFILSVFFLFIFSGAVDIKSHNPPDLIDEFEVPCTRTPGEMADSDGSCEDYPVGMIDLLMLDEEFDDFETKYVYIKAEGEFSCGYIFLNPKSGHDCYYENKVPGPQTTADNCNIESLNLVEIGYWENCHEMIPCGAVSVPYTIGEHTITFYGYEVDGNDSYWYYKVESGENPAISHLSFFLMCPDASLGDYVWYDENEDGLQHTDEIGINDVLVKLYDENDQMVDQMYTMTKPSTITREGSYRISNDGFYMFTDLMPGDYYLTFEYAPGYCSCNIHMGDPEMDSDIMDDEITPSMSYTPDIITLNFGDHNMTIDGGLVLIPLPVKFGDFTVENVRNQIELKWTTLSEINNEGFYIEKTTDGMSEFFDIGFVKGVGTSNELNEYSYVDLNLGRSSSIAYRLRQVDTDGNESYSAIRSLNMQYENEYDVFPNPTMGVVSMILPESSHTKKVNIYNTIGQMIYSVNIAPNTRYYQIDLSGFDEGIYLIRLEDGIDSRIKKIILNY